MNCKKTIKDLRELNSQLKGQYSDEQNRNYCLQCKIDKLEKENQQLKEQLERSEKSRKEAIDYIEKFVPIDVDTILMREKQRDYLIEILDIDKGE